MLRITFHCCRRFSFEVGDESSFAEVIAFYFLRIFQSVSIFIFLLILFSVFRILKQIRLVFVRVSSDFSVASDLRS